MKRVVLTAQSPNLVWALHRQFRLLTGLRIAGMVDGRRSITAALAEMKPDIVLVDGPADQGVPELVAEVAAAAPDAIVVVLTPCEDPQWTDELFEAGANALIARSLDLGTVGTLLREIGNRTIIQMRSSSGKKCDTLATLTPREIEILRYIAQGCRNQEIADALTVTSQTVKFHLTNIYRKLDVSSRTEATRYAHMHGLLGVRKARPMVSVA
jgi:DNA-binding NarL/FixJ family response regulator